MVASNMLATFIRDHQKLAEYKEGKPIVIDGKNLSVPAITAVARYGASVTLDESDSIKEIVAKSRKVITDKVDAGTSVYGVSTGFGGSADTRTDQPINLGNALLQHQHAGILPSSQDTLTVLPLLDPFASTSMPESWVRGAITIRMNSLIRGHSGVRWELIEKMGKLLSENITPLVPLRGSISASGDLSPLSYIAGTLIGEPAIRVFDGPATFGYRQVVPSNKALASHNIEPIPLQSKEHLGILNGTAFSSSVAALALNDAVHLTLLSHVLTAMGTEALLGTRGSYDPFIHRDARPHPGQIESADIMFNLLQGSKLAQTEEHEVSIAQDQYTLRQDRYPLRTAPQFLGPQVEDILAALASVTQESNSTTDNPLIDGETGEVHHGGNFQAMAVTNAMEKTRLSLHHIGKILFAQCVELINPAMNRGLPPSLAATDPSLNYHAKGIDIAVAAYVGELGYLASPVSTHIQSAEMHNQAVNSLALISGRATINSLEVLSLLESSYLYALCQAYDLRALQAEFLEGLKDIVSEEVTKAFGESLASLTPAIYRTMVDSFEATAVMDASDRMAKVASAATNLLLNHVTSTASLDVGILSSVPNFREQVATRATALLREVRSAYLSGARGAAPASHILNKTKPIYEFVRVTLGIPMHGVENESYFAKGLGAEQPSIGQNISLIHEAIRDGKLQDIVVNMLV